MPKSILKELIGDELKTYRKFEQGVREYFELPAEANGRRDEAARDALIAFASTNFGWPVEKTKDDIRRIGKVIHQQSVAGTKAQREELAEQSAAAIEAYHSQKPEIEKQIRELQQKLSGLEQESTQFENRLADATEAAAKLQHHTSLPRCINRRVAELKRQSADVGVLFDVSEIEADIADFEIILAGPQVVSYSGAIPHQDTREDQIDRFARQLQQRGFAEHVEVVKVESDDRVVNQRKLKPSFNDFRAEIQKRLEQATAELDSKTAERKAFEDELAEIKQFYIE